MGKHLRRKDIWEQLPLKIGIGIFVKNTPFPMQETLSLTNMTRLITVCLLALMLLISSMAVASLSHYVLYTGTLNGNKIILLNVLPNGQFIDPYISYTIETSIQTCVGITHDNKYLIAGTIEQTSSYEIQPDGTLIKLSSLTTGSDHIVISPDDHIVYNGIWRIYSLDSSGILSDTNNLYIGSRFRFGPDGNLAVSRPGINLLSLVSIDNINKTFTTITTIPAGSSIRDMQFVSDGNLVLACGTDAQPGTGDGDVAVFSIQSAGISTTTQAFLDGTGRNDIVLTSDGKKAIISGSISIYTFYINSSTTTVSFPGIISAQPPNQGDASITPILITPDGRLLICQYYNSSDNDNWLASAYINSDGSITWTGYTFPYGATYATNGFDDGMYDFAVYPVYATGIPKELWKDTPPEMEIHSMQKVMGDGN